MAKESEEVAKAEAAKAKDSEVKAEESAKQWLISEDKAKAAQTLADATYEKAKSTKTDIENKGAEISDIYQKAKETEQLFSEWKELRGNYYTKPEIDKVNESINNQIAGALQRCYNLKTNKADKSSLIGLASTEYVDGRIKHVVGTAPEALDTLGEIANVLTTNKDKIGTIINQISTKADKGTVENALMGKADKNEVEKALSTKAELKNVYSKQETDEQAVKVARNELNSQGLSRIRAKIVTNSAGPFTVIESKDGTDVKVRGSVSVGAFKKFKDSINEFKEAIKGTILTKDEKPVIYRYT